MAIERRNPLPVGQYWVDVFSKDQLSFAGWIADNASSLTVDKKETFISTDPPHEWYLFTVKIPVQWNGPGFPTINQAGASTSSETADRPPEPRPVVEQLEDAADTVKGVVTVAGLGLLGYLIWKALS